MGQITFQITGGTPNYQVELIPDIGVSWTYGSAGVKTIYDIPAGSYQLKITDANGCIVISNGDIIITTTTTTEEPVTTTTCDPSKCDYGLLYNWYAVNTGKLAPTGWHVPSDAEWETLRLYVASQGWNYDGTTDAGTDTNNKQSKALAFTCGWKFSNNIGATGNVDYPSKRNISGFSGLSAGFRYDDNIFYSISLTGQWWSSTSYNSTRAIIRLMTDYSTYFTRNNYVLKKNGISVRCVRDYYEGWENDVPVIDYDGNEYDVVEIGTQLWLVQNLKVTHYNDGETIPNVEDNTAWAALTTGALCAYDNDWDTYACVPEPPTTTTTTTIIYCESPLCETALTVGTDGQGNYGFLRGFIGNIYPDCGSINAIGYFALSGGWIDVVFADNTYCDITLWIDSIEYQLGYVGYHPEYGGYVHGLQVGSNPLPSVGETCDVIICGIECTTTTTSEPITTTTTLEPTTTTTPTP